MLNLSNARDYLTRTVKGAQVIEPRGFEYLGSCDGIPMITLPFTLPGEPYSFSMDIWIEDGAIYGEW